MNVTRRDSERLKYARWLVLPSTLILGLVVLQGLPSPASPEALGLAEKRLLDRVRAPLAVRAVQAGPHRLHTAVVGDGTKPPLVLLHGHGAGLAIFYQNFDALAGAYTLYALDLPGWGRSDRPRVSLRTPEDVQSWWVTSLESWRQAVGLERFTLLGHSLGGFVAASYALAHPSHVEHLILVNAAGVTGPIDLSDGLYFHLPPQRIVRLAGPLGPRLVANARDGEAGLPAGGLLNDYFYQLSAAPPSGERIFLRLITPTRWKLPLLDHLAALTMPTTIIWGEDDDLTRPRNGVLAHERIARSALFIMPQTGHLPFLERPDAFNDLVLQRASDVSGAPDSLRSAADE